MAEGNTNEQKPRIIVDEDWKQAAQAEKEKLAREVEAAKPAAAPGGAAPGQVAAPGAVPGPEAGEAAELPPASFQTLVSSLVTQILMALGGYQDRSGQRYVDLALAKHYIETLGVLEEKTRNNLTLDEKKLLDQALYEARLHFVEIAQRVSQMG